MAGEAASRTGQGGAPRDHYRVLGLRRGAPTRQVRAACQRLAKRYAASAEQGDDQAKVRLTEVNDAARVLLDPRLRHEYDQGDARVRSAEPHAPRVSAALSPYVVPPPKRRWYVDFIPGRMSLWYSAVLAVVVVVTFWSLLGPRGGGGQLDSLTTAAFMGGTIGTPVMAMTKRRGWMRWTIIVLAAAVFSASVGPAIGGGAATVAQLLRIAFHPEVVFFTLTFGATMSSKCPFCKAEVLRSAPVCWQCHEDLSHLKV